MLSTSRLCQAGCAQIIRAVASQQPTTLFEVAFNDIIVRRLASFVGICLLALRALNREPVFCGCSTATGDVGLEPTYGARHLSFPRIIEGRSLRRRLPNGMNPARHRERRRDEWGALVQLPAGSKLACLPRAPMEPHE
jgi:hypothetical protein